MAGRSRLRTKQAVSAGGIVYRGGHPEIEVLLLETDRGVWGLPKGTPADGETLLNAATREVREETGLKVSAEEKVGTIEYWFVFAAEQQRYHKFVHFWLMRPVGGSLDQHDDEHVSVRWFPLNAALRRVTHANTGGILRRAATMLERRGVQPPDPSPDGDNP
ncbi:MAG: NUDIX hydrolase [Dehalococcoidia bacterium]